MFDKKVFPLPGADCWSYSFSAKSVGSLECITSVCRRGQVCAVSKYDRASHCIHSSGCTHPEHFIYLAFFGPRRKDNAGSRTGIARIPLQMENRDYALFCGDYFVCLHTFLLFPDVNNVPIRLFCRHKILYLSNSQSLR